MVVTSKDVHPLMMVKGQGTAEGQLGGMEWDTKDSKTWQNRSRKLCENMPNTEFDLQ
jgi:hypothetical protein